MPKRRTAVLSNPILDAHAAEIIKLGRRSFADVVEIGRRLVLCREQLKNQRGWLAWIQGKFGWSRAHADNLIRIYMQRDKLLKFSTLLPISALYLLAKQEPEVLQRIAYRVAVGEPVTARAVKVIVTQHERETRSVRYPIEPLEVRYPIEPPEVLGPQATAASDFVERLIRLAALIPDLDLAEVAAAVERHDGAERALRVMAQLLRELGRRAESAPLELVASASDETKH